MDESISSFPYDTPSRASSSIHVAHPGYRSSFDEFNIFPPDPLRPINTTFSRTEYEDSYSSDHDSTSLRTPTFSSKSSAPSTIMPTAFDNGVISFLAGNYAEARTYFQKAAEEAREQADVRREADSLRHLGTTCRHLQEFDLARSHLLTARQMYESLGAGYRQEQLQCTRHLARVEADSGYQKVALVDYQELMRITAEEGFITQHAWCSYYLGHLYNQMGIFWEARNVLKDVVNISREIQDAEIEGFATEECGYTAERQGFPQLAMDCYQRALAIFQEHGGGRWIANENRVKRRIDLLSGGHQTLFNTGSAKKKSFGARLFKSGGVRA
ncbi:hypothetical protein RhiJN_11566 [Ceratobasidium sp. AG-Ba]|nr:hypothetical protein RhiJN_11566 [Ceratobasidium sp. AG-Ba]